MVTNVLLDFFREGGLVFMFPLLALSVLSLAVLIERTVFLASQAMRFKRLVRTCERTGSTDALESHFDDAAPGDVAASILRDARSLMKNRGRPYTFEQAVERSAGNHTPLFAQRLWILRAIGQIAPFLGLTGTVVGLAMAFRGIAEEGISQQSVAKGIAVALNTTIMGLVITLPTLFGEHALRAWAQSQFQKTASFLNVIAFRMNERRQSTAPGGEGAIDAK